MKMIEQTTNVSCEHCDTKDDVTWIISSTFIIFTMQSGKGIYYLLLLKSSLKSAYLHNGALYLHKEEYLACY